MVDLSRRLKNKDSSLYCLSESQRVYVCDFYFLKAAAQFSEDIEVESSDEATVSPMVNLEEQQIMRKKILDSQYKCFEKMNRDPSYNKSGRPDESHPGFQVRVSRSQSFNASVCWCCRSVLQSELGWLAVLG